MKHKRLGSTTLLSLIYYYAAPPSDVGCGERGAMKTAELKPRELGKLNLLFDNCEDPDYPEETWYMCGVIATFHGFVWVFQTLNFTLLEFVHEGSSYTQKFSRKIARNKLPTEARKLVSEALNFEVVQTCTRR